MSCQRFALLNEKGGTGKTTLTLNLGAYLAGQNKRVLMVDMDPQGHLGKSLGINVRRIPKTTFDLLLDARVELPQALIRSRIPNLDMVLSNKRLSDAVLNIGRHRDRHLKLRTKLGPLADYDFLLIDSPPSLGLLTVNILLAVSRVIIPVSCSFLALDGCAEVLKSLRMVRRHLGHTDLDVGFVVPTLYHDTALAREVVRRLAGYFNQKLGTTIPYDVSIDQAQSYGQTVFEFAPHSAGTEALSRLGEEVIRYAR
ncbi:MAG: ParA family protein [Proteobacteria bacterium]|nr:ParA family protein [Pseudomonadota bacterium]MBU1742474.1 ParA family protein [Pseudomonadota bacterium]